MIIFWIYICLIILCYVLLEIIDDNKFNISSSITKIGMSIIWPVTLLLVLYIGFQMDYFFDDNKNNS